MEREENIRPRVENLDGWCRQAHVQLLEGQIVRVRKSQKSQKEYVLKEHRDLGKHKEL